MTPAGGNNEVIRSRINVSSRPPFRKSTSSASVSIRARTCTDSVLPSPRRIEQVKFSRGRLICAMPETSIVSLPLSRSDSRVTL